MAENDTPSMWQFVPVATTLIGAGLSIAGGVKAAGGAEDAGQASYDASLRAGTAFRDFGTRVATSERIKGSRAKASSEFSAQQAEVNATQQLAASQRIATSERVKASRIKAASEFQAEQYTVNAGQQLAASQREALEERRQANLVQSRAIALAAASGAGATDPSVAYLVGRIKGEGALRAANALYAGEDRARVLRMSAAAKKYEGLTAEEAGELNAQDAIYVGEDQARLLRMTAAAERYKGLTAEEAAELNAQDAIAGAEAKATAEEAKGVAAREAGKVAASTALNRGVTGALPAANALGQAASLYDKYNSGGQIIKGGTARDSGVDRTTEEAMSADEAWKADMMSANGAIEREVVSQNLSDYYAAVNAEDLAMVATAADDFAWLELIDFAF